MWFCDVLKRKISKLKDHCARIGRNPVLIACLTGEEDKVIKEIVDQRKKQVHGMKQVREAENASLVGSPENIISGLNRYINVGITHFIMDFVGLSENTIKLFDSSVIKKI